MTCLALKQEPTTANGVCESVGSGMNIKRIASHCGFASLTHRPDYSHFPLETYRNFVLSCQLKNMRLREVTQTSSPERAHLVEGILRVSRDRDR